MTTEAVICCDHIINQHEEQTAPASTQFSSQEENEECIEVQQVPADNCETEAKQKNQQPNLEPEGSNSDDNLKASESLKSSEELKIDFSENEKILASLSFNIEDLFKKISSLTEQVQSEIGVKPIGSASSLDKIQSPRKKIQVPIAKIEVQAPIQLFQAPIEVEPQSNQITMRMFEVGQSLGHGKFGQVLECRHKSTGCLFALKKVFKSTIQQYRMQDQFLIELEAIKRMDHPNIIKSFTAFTDDFHIFTITEYALGVQLTKKFNSSEEVTSRIIYQVLNALQHMHEKGVVHRDLKPQNIMINESGLIKICDFGWSSLTDQEEKMTILCGTLDYVCPEMVNGQTYTKEVDLWSVGILTYELIFGLAPFKAEGKSATFNKVKQLEYTFPGAYRFSEQCLDFIRKLLKPEEQRMRLAESLAHPFIASHNKAETFSEEWSSLFD